MKPFTLILALLMMLLLVGCNNSEETTGTTESSDTTSIGIVSESKPNETQPQAETLNSTETVENNAIIDNTESVGRDVETTETVEPQFPSDSLTEIEPNQSHVGKWRYLFAHEGKTYEASEITLTIMAVDSETIVFSYTEYKGLELETVAVKKDGKYVFAKDISPYFDFYHYDYGKYEGCNNITGYFEFYADCISYTMTGPTNRTSSTKYTEKHETGTSPRELPDDAAKVIDGVIGTLEEKGWEGIKRIKTEPDSLKRWNVKIDPYDPEYKTVIYNLLGSYNGVDVVVRIVFNDQTQKWEPVEVYYANQHGTLLKDDTLKAFRDYTGKTDFILHADDSDLFEYFRDTPKEVTPNERHIGTWLSENSTYWANVISVGNDQVTVNFGSARSFGLEAVAVERDGKYYFSKELSPYFHWSPYSTVFRSYEDLINGYIEFSEDSLTVTAEKLFLGTEGDIVSVKFLKQAENTDESAPEPVIPDESYVGEWRHYIEVDSGYIEVVSAEKDSVKFILDIYKGKRISATAVNRDGKYVFGEEVSPNFEYSHYDIKVQQSDETKGSGYLTFLDGGIVINFDHGDEFMFDFKTENFTTKRVNAEKSAKAVLEENDWEFDEILFIDHGDYGTLGENVKPYSNEMLPLRSIIGTSGNLIAVIRIIYDIDTDEWRHADTYYVHTDGKVLQGEELCQFMKDHGKTGTVLPADDADLIEYFS